jgi:anti-sigma regulatory factor (Ser/Thr protein kinase)
MQVSIEVPVEAEAPAIAREVVASALVGVRVAEDRIEDLRLLTSEIVTNAIRHAGLEAGDTIGLAVDVSEERVRVRVEDDGPGFEPAEVEGPFPGKAGGWGLVLVQQLADAWGVVRNDPNLVWFELSL